MIGPGMVVRDGLLPGGVARCVDEAKRIHWLPTERLRAVKR